MKLEFLDREVQNCMQIRPEGAEFHGDERKDSV